MTQVFSAGGRTGADLDLDLARCVRLACRAAAALLVAGAGLSACSPALDWRQLRPEGWGLAVSLPCRPADLTRQVPLAGAPVEWRLLACSADGHTFAMASADMADPARVDPALHALGAAALANVRGRVDAEQPAAVPGMTPYPGARRWQVTGRLPDGAAVREQVLVFAHGLRVYQATVVGPRAGSDMAQPFFDSIEVAR